MCIFACYIYTESPCEPNPCFFGSTCNPANNDRGYNCNCMTGYTGNNCETVLGMLNISCCGNKWFPNRPNRLKLLGICKQM